MHSIFLFLEETVTKKSFSHPAFCGLRSAAVGFSWASPTVRVAVKLVWCLDCLKGRVVGVSSKRMMPMTFADGSGNC